MTRSRSVQWPTVAMVTLLLSSPVALLAGVNHWSSTLPDGAGEVLSLVSHPAQPGRLFAGGWMAGVFRSLDGGRSWSDVTGPVSPFITSVAVDPTDVETVYATSYSDGQVWRSTTAGASWEQVGAPGFTVAAIAVNPADPATLLATTWGGGGVFISTNRGDSWTATGSELGSFWGYCAAWMPGSATTAYVGGLGGVYRTLDGGDTWTRADEGLPGGITVLALAIDPVAPQVLYTSVFGFGVYRSGDGGASWTPLTNGLTQATHWALAVDPANHEHVYAASDAAGVFRSTDGGASWSPLSDGLRRPHARSLATAASGASRVWVGTGAGAYELAEGGQRWDERNAGLANVVGIGVAVSPSNPRVAYAGCSAGGVYRSDDAGGSWRLASGGPLAPFVGPVAVHPFDPTRAVTGVSIQTFTFSPTNVVFFRTADSGATWVGSEIVRIVNYINDIAYDPKNPDMVWAAAGNPNLSVARSTNGGETWQTAYIGLPAGAVGYSISIDPENTNNMYAAMAGGTGVYKTNNFAQNWFRRSEGLGSTDVRIVRVAPSAPRTVYAGTFGHGVFRTTNGADSWQAAGALPEGAARAVWAIAIDPASAERVWIGTSGGVFASQDSGATWTPMSAGLPAARPVWSLAFDPSGPRLHAAVVGGKGVYTHTISALPGLSLTPEATVAVGHDVSLTITLYPAQDSDTTVALAVDPPGAPGVKLDVPAIVTVPAGQAAAPVTVTARSLGAPVTITASLPERLGGDSAVALVTVTPREPRKRLTPP